MYIPIQKVDEEKRLVYGVAIAEERDNANEIFDYASSKSYIAAWSADTLKKTDGKSAGNLRAMHNAVSAGKLTRLDFDDEKKSVAVCAKVIDDNEWQKVLEGIYTGFSFGGSAIRKWTDTALSAVRYTLNPNELSLADKPCVPSAIFFDVVKVDGTTEKRQFKKVGGTNIVIKIQKNMDMTQFLELMQNVKDGLAADEATPENLTAAVENIVNVLTECTGGKAEGTGEPPQGAPEKEPKKEPTQEPVKEAEKAVESGCPTEKVDVAGEIRKVFASMSKSMEDMQKRIAKMESQPASPKAVKLVAKTDDGKGDPPADPDGAALAEIKKAHNFTTCAY